MIIGVIFLCKTQTIIKPISIKYLNCLINWKRIMNFEEVMKPLYQFRMELMRKINPDLPNVEDDLSIEYKNI